ncbi:MAG: 5-formyltetrahydrofolate cyclo-ligase [Deltaproteobacteria bacterium]|nr:MAG: 5-formyltetrahydrofolate cyclo-ligase [Deltaproteobacteria bacterium]
MSPQRKRTLRRELRAWRDALDESERRAAIAAAVGHLLDAPLLRDAATVALYAAMPGEPDLRPLLERVHRQGGTVALPVVARRAAPLLWRAYRAGEPLIPSDFGVPEPGPDAPTVHPESIDLVVVPALVVDRRGFRIGYGGGYYDRSLPQLTRARRVWIGLEEQIHPDLPVEPFDQPVHALLTRSGFSWTPVARAAPSDR